MQAPASAQVGIPVLGVVENMAALAQPLSSFRLLGADGRDATQRVAAALQQAGLQPEARPLLRAIRWAWGLG